MDENRQAAPLSNWMLRFDDASMEQRFKDAVTHSRLVQLRFALGLALVLFILFSLLDTLLISPEHLPITRTVTLGVIIPIIIAEIIISFIPGYAKIRIPLVILGTVFINLASLYVISKIGLQYILIIEIILMIIWINILSGFQLLSATVATLIISFQSVLLVLFAFPVKSEVLAMSNYIFAIVASGSIGLLSAYLLERSAKYNYYHSEKLNIEVERRKIVEHNLIAAKEAAEKATQSKSKFLAHMSHELRTPLNAIIGFSGMIMHDPGMSIDNQQRVDIINSSGEHLLSMINDVLEISKIEVGCVELDYETFDLPKMLKDIGRIFNARAESKLVSFRLELDPKLLKFIKSDTTKLRQILINLLGNAVKFTHEGFVIFRAQTSQIENDISTANLIIEVEDSGSGITKSQLKTIFDPFVQAGSSSEKYKGTGLGLAITKSFVELMGGEILVESEPERGSIFKVILPITPIEADQYQGLAETRREVVGLEPGYQPCRILVVEDESANRLLLTSLLKQVGFDTREAVNGEEAISLFKSWHPHFIWIDMRMPVMDGYEATQIIRGLSGSEKVRIVALTASAFKEERQKILGVGCDDVVHKPFQPYEIFDVMKHQLGVRYRYEEQEDDRALNQAFSFSPDILNRVPPSLFLQLTQAARRLNIEEVSEIVGEIRQVDAETAAVLEVMVHKYQFSKILSLIQPYTEQT
ncbi:MAG: ATP-binding protein [Candidatus Sedimenticola sp. 20ELBAFRAG]